MGRVFSGRVFEPELAGEFVTESPRASLWPDDPFRVEAPGYPLWRAPPEMSGSAVTCCGHRLRTVTGQWYPGEIYPYPWRVL